MAEGKVKWFNTRKGYGFISTDDGKDIFVHYSNITAEGYKTLAEGDPVTFDVVDGEKGLRAENVVPKGAAKTKSAPRSDSAPAPKARPAPKKKPAPEAEEQAPEAEDSAEDESDAENQ
ncbi:MAG: cold shock domain-containing protein [Sedimentisphaerales bacterium]|nr:cold shock domain-containing protein [Sedimentisphaerales bacterium]